MFARFGIRKVEHWRRFRYCGFGLNNNSHTQSHRQMLIKSADSKALESLLTHPEATKEKQKLIEQQIRNIRAGVKGEYEASYEIDFHMEDSKNWAIIHDLRITVGGNVAQLDHVIINRLLDIYVCESKHFSEGVAINESGEFTAFYKSKPYGVPSPISQNERHTLVIRDFFKTYSRLLPTRLGFAIQPNPTGIVLVSKNARISRPKTKVRGIDSVIKTDNVREWIEKDFDKSSTLSIVKVISSETLREFATAFAAKHTPIEFDWHAKFGLRKDIPVVDVPPAEASVEPTKIPVTPSRAQMLPVETQVEAKSETVQDDVPEKAPKEKKKLICMKCDVAIEFKVARFCWLNKRRFGGNAYCQECQSAFPK